MLRSRSSPLLSWPMVSASEGHEPNPGAPPAALQPAAPRRAGWKRHAALFVVVAALVGIDLWSKGAVFGWLDSAEGAAEVGRSENGQPRYRILGLEWLGFMLNLNYGAAFGQGASAQGVLVAGRCLAALFLSVLIVRTPAGQRLYLTALVLILAGALGNLYDNLFFEPHPGLSGYAGGRRFGPVRDFIDVYFTGWDWHFPTFNVADSCITVGAVLLLLSGFFGGDGPAETEKAGESVQPR